ncbi:uncharacterized protein LOC134815051 [Bolinopsis microptera]|uniref:uncharacterized protein LOC134815051 n=1 Tax=Bolinopsis microptera TaxID=2820187 RepID=UPI003079A80E
MGGHGLPMPKGPMNIDPLMWTKGLSRFTKHALKHDKGLWMIVAPTIACFAYAFGMIGKKILNDPNIIIPLPWVDPQRYENNFDRDATKMLMPWNVTPTMRDGFKDRYKNLKRPEDIE